MSGTGYVFAQRSFVMSWVSRGSGRRWCKQLSGWEILLKNFLSASVQRCLSDSSFRYLRAVMYGQCYYKTLIGNHIQSIEWYHFQWPWLTIDPDFKVVILFDTEYLRNGTRQSHIYYRTSVGSNMRSIERWHFNDLEGPLTRFSRSRHNFKLNISKTVRLTDKVTIAH